MSARVASHLSNPIAWQHYRDLPAVMYTECDPSVPPAPAMVEVNQRLVEQFGIDADWVQSPEGLSILSGASVDPANRPLAMAYGGHQFGGWVPLLGDGRAHMLGQVVTADGARVDVQLKGSGRTRYSRGGDGRATLGAVLREYMISEAMAGLGIPTTRSLAVVRTGEVVVRERDWPGAILVRTAASHLRVGTFQYAAATLDHPELQTLADFLIARHFPELSEAPQNYSALLDAVITCQAELVAQWMLVGFIHGVMNTDNMSLVGETIDYGPCAFMDEFHPHKVFSSIDRFGRYAWSQQPAIAVWNLTQFAQSILPLLDAAPETAQRIAEERLGEFAPQFEQAFYRGWQRKLGITGKSEELPAFIPATLGLMAESGIDFTVFFERLTRVAAEEPESLVLELFDNQNSGADWLQQWHALCSGSAGELEAMKRANPVVIARNHRVEQAIEAAVDGDDLAPFRRLCRVLADPYNIAAEDRELQVPPLPAERVTQTFCGT